MVLASGFGMFWISCSERNSRELPKAVKIIRKPPDNHSNPLEQALVTGVFMFHQRLFRSGQAVKAQAADGSGVAAHLCGVPLRVTDSWRLWITKILNLRS